MQERTGTADERTPTTGPVAEPRAEFLLRFERLLSGVSSELIAARHDETSAKLEEAIRAVVEFFGVDRAALVERSPDGQDMFARVGFGRPGVPVSLALDASFAAAVPWYTEELIHGRVVRVDRVSNLPPEASRERDFMQSIGMKAHLGVPVLMNEKWRYVFGISSFTSEVDWPADLVPRMRILAEMFAYAYEHARLERERERLLDAERAARVEVEHLLRFERLLSDVSSALISAPSVEIPARIEESLRAVAEFFGVDRAALGSTLGDPGEPYARITYGRPGIGVVYPPGSRLADVTPWYAHELSQGRIVRIGRVSELPPEAWRAREMAEQYGLKANLTIPVLMHGLMHGEWRYVLSLSSYTGDVDWPDDLIPRVKILAEMLAHAYEHARAERLRDDFIAIASHELRTPFTSLQLAVQALSRKFASEPEARRFLGTIERQAANVNLLVDRLLDAAHVAGGPLSLVRSVVDLTDVARAAVAQLQEPLRSSGSALTVDAPTPIVGSWDGVRLGQVATNLVANAIKFGAGAPIEVIVRAEGNAATLVVRDHGIGIPLAKQARIFDRFERAVSSRHFGRFGLGLYISKAIVDAHGGSIEVTSRPGEGSTFVVRLPLASESLGTAAAPCR
jgi:signal transduction histidine kinase